MNATTTQRQLARTQMASPIGDLTLLATQDAVVAIHWDWACERLDARQANSLKAWTARELAFANLTI